MSYSGFESGFNDLTHLDERKRGLIWNKQMRTNLLPMSFKETAYGSTSFSSDGADWNLDDTSKHLVVSSQQ